MKHDVARVMKAFDTDNNGLIEENEFVDWVTNGLRLSKEERAEFASHTPLSAKLSDLLSAVNKYIAFRVGDKGFSNAKLRRKRSG